MWGIFPTADVVCAAFYPSLPTLGPPGCYLVDTCHVWVKNPWAYTCYNLRLTYMTVHVRHNSEGQSIQKLRGGSERKCHKEGRNALDSSVMQQCQIWIEWDNESCVRPALVCVWALKLSWIMCLHFFPPVLWQISIWQQNWGKPCWTGTMSWSRPSSRCTPPTRSSCRRSRWYILRRRS